MARLGGGRLWYHSGMRPDSILLLGPTGAGKTPLGGLWQDRGLAGRACHHFDFGAELRRAASGGGALDPDELRTVRCVLETGALLEDAEFPIALKILTGFLARRSAGPNDLLVLNGLPRHAGQAAAMEERVRLRAVVRLSGGPDVIQVRIAADAGGDRAGRIDDGRDAVAARLALYEARTRPLAALYARAGVPVLTLEVTAGMGVEEMDAALRPRLAAVHVR